MTSPMDHADMIPLACVGAVALIAAATDLWKFKVYNALTFPALLAGLAVSAWLGGFEGLKASALGAGLGFGTLVVFFALGGVGAGDVKLMTAVGAWIGPSLTIQVFLAASMAAGVYALILLFVQGGAARAIGEVLLLIYKISARDFKVQSEGSIESEVRRADRRRRLVPFAAMICVGFAATILWHHRDLDKVWPPHDRPVALEGGNRP